MPLNKERRRTCVPAHCEVTMGRSEVAVCPAHLASKQLGQMVSFLHTSWFTAYIMAREILGFDNSCKGGNRKNNHK